MSAFSVSEHVQQLLVGGGDSTNHAVVLVGRESWPLEFVLHRLELGLVEASELLGVHLDVAADVVAFAVFF